MLPKGTTAMPDSLTWTFQVDESPQRAYEAINDVRGWWSGQISGLALDSWLAFPDDKEEWTGTTVTFDVTEVDGRTEVRFTHHGLAPEVECYDVCWVAWGGYITRSLRDLITTGTGRPNSIESPEAVEQVRA